MIRLIAAFVAVMVLSCGGGRKDNDASARQMSPEAREKKVLVKLEAELSDNNGLRVENAWLDADSVHASFSLSDEAVEAWISAEHVLGRPPILVSATVRVNVSGEGQPQGTQSLRFGGLRGLNPHSRSVTLALPRRPMRGSGQLAEALPAEGPLACTVVAARVQ